MADKSKIMSAREIWKKIKEEVGVDGKEIETFSLNKSNRKIFLAFLENGSLKVKSCNHPNSCSISAPREIKYEEFEYTYNHYDDYVSGVKGIRKKIQHIYFL